LFQTKPQGLKKMKSSRNSIIVDLLRHGECRGGDIYRGSTDVELTDRGWEQMQAALSAIVPDKRQSPWQKIFSSPLQRCRLFSEAQGKYFATPVSIEHAFREMDFGEWEGRALKEVWSNDREAVDRFYQSPDKNSPPNGESMQALLGRLMPAWTKILHAHRGEHILIVQHGGTIRALISWLLQMPLTAATRLDIPYASLSRFEMFEYDGDFFPRLLFLNGMTNSTGEF
jgi:alpha-ribazole phosphatase